MYATVVFCFAFAVFEVSADRYDPRNIPVRLNNYGPTSTLVKIFNGHVQSPVLERLPLRTAGCIPKPEIIGNTCTCYKTILKPQVHNQIVSVPSVQRIIQTTARPVLERIHYRATPMETPTSSFDGTVFPASHILYNAKAQPKPLVKLSSCPYEPNIVFLN